jgi:hypothetical protein
VSWLAAYATQCWAVPLTLLHLLLQLPDCCQLTADINPYAHKVRTLTHISPAPYLHWDSLLSTRVMANNDVSVPMWKVLP